MNESINESSSVLIGEKSIDHLSHNSKQSQKEVRIKKVILQNNQNLMKINKVNKSRVIIQQSQAVQKNNIVIKDQQDNFSGISKITPKKIGARQA